VKILWHSNAPHAPSGYGNQTKLFAPLVRELGHDVAISAFYGAKGTHFQWEGMTVYPAVADDYGADILTPHALHHFGGDTLRAGLILTLLDIWVLPPSMFDNANVACWVPIDHDPVPPRVADWFRQAPGAVPIAMTRFGQKALEQALPGRLVEYVPHGVDCKAFDRLDDEGRAEARARFGVTSEDTFVVGMVAANQGNPSRKSFGEALDAFAKFHTTRPDSVLYLHTEREGRFHGVNLPSLIEAVGIPKQAVRFVSQYPYLTGELGDQYMRAAYNAMDVLLAPSMGEGFGIPLMEAQACGTPVITTNMTACPEVGAVGWHVGGQRFWTSQDSWQIVPSVREIVQALEDAAGGMAYRKRGAARAFATTYHTEQVADEHFAPVLQRIADGIDRASRGEYLVPSDDAPVFA
jgi:glycosyltransferase involved in cell wall biosynthesis